MDIFPDRESAALFADQMHDYNPGITEEGLFWTLLVAPESVHTTGQRTELCLQDQFIPDMGTFENAVVRGPMDPATIAIECEWQGSSNSREEDRSDDNQYVFRFRPAEGAVEWNATGPTGTFHSVMTETPQETLYGAIGNERNGRFFS